MKRHEDVFHQFPESQVGDLPQTVETQVQKGSVDTNLQYTAMHTTVKFSAV